MNAASLRDGLVDQFGQLFAWMPVAYGTGIGTYFALRAEPAVQALALSALVALFLAAAALRFDLAARAVALSVSLALLGFAVAGARSHRMAEPVLSFRYYGPVEGRIIAIDRSASDAVRLTLDTVVLKDMAPLRTPARVRVSLHGDQRWIKPEPGMTVILTGHLSPPSGPAEPGGFDFRRHAWFQKLGAVGYTRNPVLMLEPARGMPVSAVRQAASDRVRAALPGATGGVATAILTGDRSGVPQDTLEALRQSNLAHLLAISGLHMGLVAGFVFAAARIGLVAIPGIGLRWPVKTLAAILALAAAAGYLALSGGNVATERAFVMVAVALTAVMLDRRALSLRAVALAALIILTLSPEALLSPGFQMSFAATTALVAAFEALRDAGTASSLSKINRWVLALVLSSSVAGAATAPFAIAHFNQISHFGLIANLASVPLMGALVMPCGVLAMILMPLGLEALPLAVMELGLDWILGVAKTVSMWPGAVGTVKAPPSSILPLVAFGGLMVVLGRRWLRLAGAIPMLAAIAIWASAERPILLISDDGALVGVSTPHGRALSRERGAGFVASIWLENDGDAAEQDRAAQRWPDADSDAYRIAEVGGARVIHVRGKRAAADLTECGLADLVVADSDLSLDGSCTVLGPKELRSTGAVAFSLQEGALVMTTARRVTGNRLWVARPREEAKGPQYVRINPTRRP